MQKFTLQVPAIGDYEPYTHVAVVPVREGELNCATLFRVLHALEQEPYDELRVVAAWLNMPVPHLESCTEIDVYNDVLACVGAWFNADFLSSLDSYKLPKTIQLGLGKPIDLEEAKAKYSIGLFHAMQEYGKAPHLNGCKIIAQGLGLEDNDERREWVGSLPAGIGYQLLRFFLRGKSTALTDGVLSRFTLRAMGRILKVNTLRLSRRLS